MKPIKEIKYAANGTVESMQIKMMNALNSIIRSIASFDRRLDNLEAEKNYKENTTEVKG